MFVLKNNVYKKLNKQELLFDFIQLEYRIVFIVFLRPLSTFFFGLLNPTANITLR